MEKKGKKKVFLEKKREKMGKKGKKRKKMGKKGEKRETREKKGKKEGWLSRPRPHSEPAPRGRQRHSSAPLAAMASAPPACNR